MAIQRKFKVGDLVRLKSGGPLMTVKDVYDDPNNPFLKDYGGYVKCTWFDEKNALRSSEFQQDTIELGS